MKTHPQLSVGFYANWTGLAQIVESFLTAKLSQCFERFPGYAV